MNIVLLDGETITRDDVSWDILKDFGNVHYFDRTRGDEVVNRMSNADIVLVSKCIIDKEVIDLCPRLRYIGVLATGYNNVDIDYAAQKGIAVTNVPAYSTGSVAQFTFSLLLDLVNKVADHSQAVKQGAWQNAADFSFTLAPQIELTGLTLGLIGFGNIGKKVAAIAEAFGMNVIINSSRPGPAFVNKEEIFAKSDVISLHCPLNDATEGIICKKNIEKMKDGVIILNVSRGGLVIEDDLAEALKSGKVKAAGLDVLNTEPPRHGSPLIGLKNCTITPHMAWTSNNARQALLDIVVKNLQTFLDSERLNRIV